MEDAALIKLTMRGTVVAKAEAAAWAAQREAFGNRHCIRLPQLLDPSIVGYVLPKVASDRSRLYTHDHDWTNAGERQPFAREIRFGEDHPVNNLFYILLNQRSFLQAVENICGCSGKLRNIDGRYFERHPATDQFDSWHNDNVGRRMVGFSINLSPQPYAGGQFQLRDQETKRIYATVDSQLGDGHVFRIHRQLEHRVTTVVGTAPKCSYAGWLLGENGGDAKRARQADLPAAALQT